MLEPCRYAHYLMFAQRLHKLRLFTVDIIACAKLTLQNNFKKRMNIYRIVIAPRKNTAFIICYTKVTATEAKISKISFGKGSCNHGYLGSILEYHGVFLQTTNYSR